MLPKVIVDDDIEKWERIYRKASVAVFDEVIAEAHAFNERYEEVQNIAGKLLDVLNLNMTDLFKSTFNEIFKSYIEQIGTCFYIKGIYENDNTILRRLSGGFCGGLVGVRGGLTTPDKNYGGMVGDVAIDIMETAYRLRYDLYGKIIKDIEPFITGYAGKIHNSESEIEKEKTRLLNLFRERFDREANFNTFSRYCTYTMLNQSFLETAFCKEEAKWRLRGAKSIEGCLPELEDMYLGDNWARSRNLISVLKDILWDMIEESIKIRNN